ncbi:Mg chelatase, subunit ChlI [Thermodesulfatator indicus DSM 15286]|uniref:Mg chelatase, subunit ChlI n=1 Tax=Thermodesulfatator indicus (strain DSM 15286 / JCM 11887 / CIR29812) TaxID=667014 RepID=F8A921_THEID|nr:YifB family Mg chelatase-like AAA ATPase [Thermodesulfatator indicus]AEH45149.1 Mg chelatase, subunit ChlI [Thermodesulfatator indicus DSM 15286]
MLAKTFSASLWGVEARLIEVEVDISYGLPGFSLVGLPQGAVKESKERLRAAFKNAGFDFPDQKITVNLAPADLKKEGSGFDLPIAVGLLVTMRILPQERVSRFIFYGELSLDGKLKGVRGILPVALLAKERGLFLFCPFENAKEASLVKGLQIFTAEDLAQLVAILRGEGKPPQIPEDAEPETREYPDLSEIIGQEQAKRALEISAAGGHNVLLVGPPGSGKSMLAKRLPGLLPPLSYEEALETTRIYSVAGLLSGEHPVLWERPFRAPHHTVSDAGLIGGGNPPRPGEISLAHRGVLFLDELPEFRRNTLEALRQPLEEGQITVSRANMTITYPAKFTLIAAMNPCRCGHYGDKRKACQCTPQEVRRYRQKISGPLLDRIDIQIEVPAVEIKDLSQAPKGESSKTVAERVSKAREIQKKRFKKEGFLNAHMGNREINSFCQLGPQERAILEKAADKLNLSARAWHRVIKIARTIADLEGEKNIRTPHLLEALQYRLFDRPLW